MKCMRQVFVLWVFWVLILSPIVPCLDQKPEPAPQKKLTYLVPWRGNCLWFKFRKCGCPSGTLNYSLCHHTGMNSASEMGQVWEKLLKVIPRPSVSHSDLFCGTCVLVGNSKILRASGLSNVTQHTTVFRMNQAPVRGFKTVGINHGTFHLP